MSPKIIGAAADLTFDVGRDFLSTFQAPAIREITWCKQYGGAQLPDELGIREITEFNKALPQTHITLLELLRLGAIS